MAGLGTTYSHPEYLMEYTKSLVQMDQARHVICCSKSHFILRHFFSSRSLLVNGSIMFLGFFGCC